MSDELELHIAGEEGSVSDALRKEIGQLGFRDDPLIGKSARFSHEFDTQLFCCPLIGLHATWDCFNRREYSRKLEDLKNVVRSHSTGFVGYAHGEIIKPEWDINISRSDFDASIPFPLKPFDISASTKAKEWDIHISARRSQLAPELEETLFQGANMYFIDLLKSHGESRIFTIQGTNDWREGLEIFAALRSYVNQAGGMEGAIKYERTIYFERWGNAQIVPPTISNFEYAASEKMKIASAS